MTRGRAAAALAACAAAALVAAALLRHYAAPAPPEFFSHDQQSYLSMARTPFVQTPEVYAPASFRILPSLLARGVGEVVGGGPERGFLVLTFAAFAAMPTLAFLLLGALGVTPAVAAICAAVVALSPTVVGYLSWDVVRVDAFALLLLFVAAHAAITCRRGLLVAAVAALALTKETAVIAVFFAVAWAVRVDRRLTAAAIASAVVMVLLRFVWLPRAMPPQTAEHFDNLFAFKEMIREELTIRYAARRLLLASASTWNLMLPFAAAWLAGAVWTRRGQVLLATVAVAEAQILFASDTQRIVAAAYPFVIASCAFELERLDPRKRAIAGSALVVGQLAWLCEYGRVAPLGWLRGVEIGIALVSGAIALSRLGRPTPAPSAATV